VTAQVRYRLSARSFQAIAGGHADTPGLDVLRSAQMSKRLLLLRAVHDLALGRPEWSTLDLSRSWTMLSEITKGRADVRIAVLGHPFVDAWARRCVRLLRAGSPGTSLTEDLAYLSGLAAAAAVRAGVAASVVMPTRDGTVTLPTVGLAHGLGDGPAKVTFDGSALSIAGPSAAVTTSWPESTDTPGWCPRREVAAVGAAGELRLAVEDLDPYRTCFRLDVAARLSRGRFARMSDLVSGAWELIGTHHRDYAETIRSTLRSIVPLPEPSIGSVSASAQSSFGSIAASVPDDSTTLALLIIHETQHMKLSALLDVLSLYDAGSTALLHAPWRADPRPVGATLQGAYAHLGVIDFYRVQRTLERGHRARAAHLEFAYWLNQTSRAVDQLASSGALNETGRRFVAEMAARLNGWHSHEPLSERVADISSDIVEATSVRWRLANHGTSVGNVASLVSAWLAGQPCPPVLAAVPLPGTSPGPAREDGLAECLRLDLIGKELEPDDGARAYLAGDYETAAEVYRHIAVTKDRDDAWAGLAVAIARAGKPDAARSMTARPELVRAMVVSLRRAGHHDIQPDKIAGWLGAALT
jgi:uncharacterized protein